MYTIKPIEWKAVNNFGWFNGYVGKIHMFSCGPDVAVKSTGSSPVFKLSINLPIQVAKVEFDSIEACQKKAFAILEFFVKHILAEITLPTS